MKRMLIALAFGAAIALPALAQEVVRKPLPANHPLIGTWRIEIPDAKCFEEYEFRADGTKASMSGKERNKSEFMVSDAPSAKGFYKWTDKITENNGEPDCFGSYTSIGHVVESFVRMSPNGSTFQLCENEELGSCFAEFQRKR